MRLAAVLASLSIAAIHPALAADPPGEAAAKSTDAAATVQAPVAAPTPDSPPANATSTSATSNAPTAVPVQADSNAARLEKRMRARGFATQMQNGEKIFCRREAVLGTRLGGALHCMHEDEARADLDRLEGDEEHQRQRMLGLCVPSGSVGGKQSFNCGS
jgi:hypothetical protein